MKNLELASKAVRQFLQIACEEMHSHKSKLVPSWFNVGSPSSTGIYGEYFHEFKKSKDFRLFFTSIVPCYELDPSLTQYMLKIEVPSITKARVLTILKKRAEEKDSHVLERIVNACDDDRCLHRVGRTRVAQQLPQFGQR